MLSSVPEFPDFRPMRLEDRELVERGFESLGRECSDFTFACYYLFRCPARPALSRLNGALLFRERCRGGGWCLLPPMLSDRPAAAAAEALRVLSGEARAPHHLASITERMWKEHFGPGGLFERREDRDNFDYVYDRAALAALRGNRYHSQKNQINRFTRANAWEYRRLTPELVEGARDLADRWCQERCETGGPLSYSEVRALKEGLGLTEELGLVAGVILVADKVEALAVGERLNAETATVHFEKANPQMSGLAQLINREFAAREFPDCRWLNRQQDLGDPGLRQAKERYNPARMVTKYAVGLLGQGALETHFDYAPAAEGRS
jgi:hypothetical protein